MRSARVRRALLGSIACTLLALLLGSIGCATGAKKSSDDSSGPMTAKVRPGAGGWSEHALRLPKDAPIVITAQLDQLLLSLDDAWEWLLAEPAMLGENGDQIVSFLRAERQQLAGAEGIDPLSPESWIEVGIDVTRKLHIGSYPVSDEDSQMVLDTVDRVVREEVGLDEEEPIQRALSAAAVLSGDEPLRMYNKVSQELDGLDPLAGFRIVVPLADAETFVSTLESFLSELELEQIEPTAEIVGQADTAKLILTDDFDFHAILLRVRGDTATVDVLYESMGASAPGMSRQRAREDALARVERLVDAFPFGRPSAPYPVGEPIAGIAVDQRGAGDFARIRGIRRALSEARGAGLEERDARFTYNLFRAFESAQNWTVASKRLTGLSYGVFVGEANRLFRLGIDLYGAGRDEPLPVSDPAVHIAPSERSIAASIDFRPMVDEEWQDWIGVKNPLDALENFDAIDFDAPLFALSFPRSLAILFTNAEKVFEERLPGWAEPLYGQREHLARLDVATAGMDIRGMRLTPKIVGVLTLEAGLEQEAIDALGASMASALANLSSQVDVIQARSEPKTDDEAPTEAEPEQPEEDRGPPSLAEPTPSKGADRASLEPSPLEPNTLSALEVDGRTIEDVQYFWKIDGEQPYLFFSYGLATEEASAEYERIRGSEGNAGERIMLFRSEAVALFSLMTFYQPDLFEPVDVGILAQRIGALSFEVTPKLRDDVQRIRYDFVVGEPPRLDGDSGSSN